MIILAPKTIEWTSSDASLLHAFLNSPTGVRFLQVLAMGAPSLLDGGHKNKTLVASGALSGYQGAVETMLKLTYENPNEPIVPEVVTSNYQSLDDDEAWAEEDKAAVDKAKNPTTS